jgi:hypothetical protein
LIVANRPSTIFQIELRLGVGVPAIKISKFNRSKLHTLYHPARTVSMMRRDLGSVLDVNRKSIECSIEGVDAKAVSMLPAAHS